MWMLLLALSTAPTATGDAADRGLVLDVAVTGDVDRDAAAALGDRVAVAVADAARFDVISKDELRQLSALAAEKQAGGCDTDACLSELAGALDARFVVQPRVSRLGDEVLFTLVVFDAVAGRAVGRGQTEAASVVAVKDALDAVVAAALRDAGQLKKKKRPKGETAPAASPSPLVVAGGVTVGVAALAAGAGVATLLYAESQLSSPATLSSASYGATRDLGRVGVVVGVGVGVVAGGVGGALLAMGGGE